MNYMVAIRCQGSGQRHAERAQMRGWLPEEGCTVSGVVYFQSCRQLYMHPESELMVYHAKINSGAIYIKTRENMLSGYNIMLKENVKEVWVYRYTHTWTQVSGAFIQCVHRLQYAQYWKRSRLHLDLGLRLLPYPPCRLADCPTAESLGAPRALHTASTISGLLAL